MIIEAEKVLLHYSSIEPIIEFIRHNENITFRVTIEDNKDDVGCMVLKACSDDGLQSHSGEIAAIYLLQNYRGIGFGKQFLKQGFVHDGTERLINRGKDLIQIRLSTEH